MVNIEAAEAEISLLLSLTWAKLQKRLLFYEEGNALTMFVRPQ